MCVRYLYLTRCLVCKNLGIFIEDYVVICRIHASNVLFMPVNNLFQGSKQSVSTCETICFEARNKVFQGGKLFVSYACNKLFAGLKQNKTAVNRKLVPK